MISTFAWAIADFLAKVLFRQHHGLTVSGYLVASWLIEICVLLIFVVWWKGEAAYDMYFSWLFRILLGVTFVLRFGWNILYYTSMRRLDASIVTVLFTFSTIVSVIIGIIIYNESLWREKWLWVALTVGSIILVYSHISRKKKQLILFWGVLWSALLYGIQANVEKMVWLTFDPFVFRLWYSLLSVLWLLVLYKHDVTHDIKYIKHHSFWVISSISALLFMTMNICYYLAFAAGAEAGKADAINNIGIFIIIALEFFIFREKSRRPIKLLAAVLSCLWVWLLY